MKQDKVDKGRSILIQIYLKNNSMPFMSYFYSLYYSDIALEIPMGKSME